MDAQPGPVDTIEVFLCIQELFVLPAEGAAVYFWLKIADQERAPMAAPSLRAALLKSFESVFLQNR